VTENFPTDLDPCTCGHYRNQHIGYWDPETPLLIGRSWCGGNPGETCVCKGFVAALAGEE